MRSKKVLNVVETHTGGQPTRTVLSGVLQIPGATMWEKYCYMQEKGDWVRTMVCQEPRGSEIMSGTLLTTPCDPRADVGILHFEAAGWLPMCGHNTIGACTTIVEEGLVEVTEPETHITLETPIGLIRAVVAVETVMAGETKAIVPEISGRAWLTSLATYILDDSDPLGKGFLLV